MKPKIHLIVGARPNYIKANPVYYSLNQLNKFEIKLVNTGQHYDENMSKIFNSLIVVSFKTSPTSKFFIYIFFNF